MTAESKPISEISIRCQHCREWFPSPIFFKSMATFDSAALLANRAQCSHCLRITGCDKENLRVRFTDGGFLGLET